MSDSTLIVILEFLIQLCPSCKGLGIMWMGHAFNAKKIKCPTCLKLRQEVQTLLA